MKQRPILFSAPMVRALLDGSKTQTRRIVKHKGELPPDWATFGQPMSNIQADGSCKPSNLFRWSEEQTEAQPLKSLRRWPGNGGDLVHDWYAIPCPYGKQGDQLWVRETHLTVCKMDDNGMFITDEHGEYIYETWYRADGIDYQYFDGQSDFPVENVPWKPSIHMPRAASRITLEITGIRVERLQDISEEDALAEGASGGHGAIPGYQYSATPLEHFKHIWQSTGGDWDANPWVWVLNFKRVEQ